MVIRPNMVVVTIDPADPLNSLMEADKSLKMAFGKEGNLLRSMLELVLIALAAVGIALLTSALLELASGSREHD